MKPLDEQKLEAILALRNKTVKAAAALNEVAAMLNEAAVNYDRAMGDREVTTDTAVLGKNTGYVPSDGELDAGYVPGESWQIDDHEFSETEVE